MRAITSKRVKAALATCVACAAGFVIAAPAPAGTGGGDATITMEFTPMTGPPSFEGSKTITKGEPLTIVNNSDPEEIGPHTFSLIEKKELPQTKQESKDCFKGKSKVCARMYKAHKVDFQNQTVGKVLVERGKDGWDQAFTKKQDGDSWFTQTETDSFTQSVSAKVGSKLVYFCVIHPEMRGKLKVVAPE